LHRLRAAVIRASPWRSFLERLSA